MNLVERYINRPTFLTHHGPVSTREMYMASLVIIRFETEQGYLYYTYKNRFDHKRVLVESDMRPLIDEMKRNHYGYIVMDATHLRRADYLMVKNVIIRYLGGETDGMSVGT